MVDGRASLIDECRQSPCELRCYLAEQLTTLMAQGAFVEAISGHLRPESDIDLGILADGPLSTAQRIDLVERVAQATGLPVDIVDLHGEPEPILGEVLRGVRLLGSSEEYAQLLYRHVVSVADFLPLRERILRERQNAWIG